MEKPKSPTIYLVEDDHYFCQLMEAMLNSIGYKKQYYFNKTDDFLQALPGNPDIIFLDYYIDDLNGLEVLKKIKQYNPEAIVIFISGQEDLNVAITTLKYGAFDYLMKSTISAEKLQAVLEKVQEFKTTKKKKPSTNFSLVSKLFTLITFKFFGPNL
ncbi:MAG: response regulator [Flavihumibacter sp.]|nr:response regulator [Flavihumibacter sp.]